MRWLSLLAAVLLAGGCGTFSAGRNEGVDAVHVFGLPVTINMDTRPGPDGFAVRVFVTKNGGAKGTVINNGSIEILMFDGAMKLEDLATQQPKERWKFSPKQLASVREQTSLGTAYRFTLQWTEAPRHGHVTVLARYVPQKGEPIYSSPSSFNSLMK